MRFDTVPPPITQTQNSGMPPCAGKGASSLFAQNSVRGSVSLGKPSSSMQETRNLYGSANSVQSKKNTDTPQKQLSSMVLDMVSFSRHILKNYPTELAVVRHYRTF